MGISINAWLHDFHNFKMQNFMKERHLKNPGEINSVFQCV